MFIRAEQQLPRPTLTQHISLASLPVIGLIPISKRLHTPLPLKNITEHGAGNQFEIDRLCFQSSEFHPCLLRRPVSTFIYMVFFYIVFLHFTSFFYILQRAWIHPCGKISITLHQIKFLFA